MAKSYDELLAEANGAKPQPSPYPDLLAMARQAQARQPVGASGSWDQAPVPTEEEVMQAEAATQEPMLPTKKPVSSPTSDIIRKVIEKSSSANAIGPASVEAAPEAQAPKAAQDEFLAKLQQAQQEQRDKERGLNMLEASQGFLKAGLRYGGASNENINQAINNEGFDKLRKQAGSSVVDLQAMRDAEKGSMEMESARSKMKDERDSKDPKSEVSSRYRDIAKQAGINVPENATAASLEKTLPWLFKAKEAAQDRELKRMEIDLKRQDLEEKRKKTANTMGLSPAQKTADQALAKKYVAWIDGDAQHLDANISRLGQALNNLEIEAKNSTIPLSGRVAGRLPDFMKSEKAIEAKQEIDKITTESLRPILGAQFTENEGEMIRKLSYDNTLSPEANIKKIKSSLLDLQKLKDSKDQMYNYLQDKGTIVGYKPAKEATEKVVAKKLYSASRNQTKIVYADGSEEIKEGKQ
jgi:hypothetical protein